MSKIAFVGLVLALLVTACGGTQEPTKGDLTVFVTVPLSGFQANGGQTVVGGARLAAEHINRTGGVNGYKLVIEALDDESDSDVAVSLAEQIAQRVQAGARTLGVVGNLNSGQTIAAMEIYRDLAINIVTPTASNPSLTLSGYRNFFRVNASDDVQARVDAEFLVSTLQAGRVAILHNDDAYGIDLASLMAAELQKLGVTVVYQQQIAIGPPEPSPTALPGRPLYYPGIVEAAVAQAPDAIFYAGYEVECPYLRYDLAQIGAQEIPFLASDGCFLSAAIESGETLHAAEFAAATESMFVSGFSPEPRATVDSAWIRDYQQVDFRNPDTYSINGYLAVRVLAEAAREAKSLEQSIVADALRAGTFDTIIGPLRYQDNGDLANPTIYIFQVTGGRFVQVFPTGGGSK
jgi:branched-chain amino acid transport system substrate-binding protein